MRAMKKKKVKEPDELKNPLNKMMPNYGVYVFSATEGLAVSIGSFIIGGLVGMVFYSGLFKDAYGNATAATQIANAVFFTALGIVAMRFLTPVYRKSRLSKQKKKLEQQFLAMLDSLAASYASGSNTQKAFQSAYTDLQVQYGEGDYIIREIRQILDAMGQNIGIDVILKDFASRSRNENIVNFAEVFYTCFSKGGNMQTTVISTYNSIREKILIEDEIQTKLTSNKMQLNVMSVMPIGIVAMLRATNPSFAEAFATLIGVIANTAAIGIFIGAYKFGQKIISLGAE